MGLVNTGLTGKPLRDIIKELGNHEYDLIEFRIKYIGLDGQKNDESFGYCKYKNSELIPLDHDSYSLDDIYFKWAEWIDIEEAYTDNGGLCLTVWEDGIEESFNKN